MIRGERIYLSALDPANAEIVVKWFNDPEVREWLLNGHIPMTLASRARVLRADGGQRYRPRLRDPPRRERPLHRQLRHPRSEAARTHRRDRHPHRREGLLEQGVRPRRAADDHAFRLRDARDAPAVDQGSRGERAGRGTCTRRSASPRSAESGSASSSTGGSGTTSSGTSSKTSGGGCRPSRRRRGVNRAETSGAAIGRPRFVQC